MPDNHITFQFISEPSDINFGGKVHGGAVMKWIDQTAYTCARNWAESYCVTVYVGGIRFYKPINIGDVVKIEANVIFTGKSSIHIATDIYSRSFSNPEFEKKTHCIIVFVSVDEDGNPQRVREWIPRNEREERMAAYALKLKKLAARIEEEMKEFY